jgi:phytoene/squalene synthetase
VTSIPFPIRRIWLLAKGVFVDRDNPRLAKLRAIQEPEEFVWAILPHTARSFAPSILLLPEKQARATAVAYLYARMIDNCEDLSATPEEARESLAAFADRFDTPIPGTAPSTPSPTSPDSRDQVHLLLSDQYSLVDDVYLELDAETRARVKRLVKEMAAGMIEFSHVFEIQGGALADERQVLDYCHRVMGLPAVFAMETLLGDLSNEHKADALEVSELIQLANITRDVEGDLKRGVGYHPALREHLSREIDASAAEAIAQAKQDLMVLATKRATSFRKLVQAVDLPRLSPARGAAVLMMLYTERHYRNCALEVGLRVRSPGRNIPSMILSAFRAIFSPLTADRILLQAERNLLATA